MRSLDPVPIIPVIGTELTGGQAGKPCGSGKTRKGNRALVEAARAGVKSKGSYLQAQYHRLKPRCGSNRSLVAVAHSILQSIYYLLVRKEPYRDLGAAHFDKRRPANTAKRLVSRLEQFGDRVTLETEMAA